MADRTAFELAPAGDGSVCIVAPRGADIALPGVVLRVRRGSPHEDDPPFMGQPLHVSSPARSYLDNLCASRGRGGRLPRTLSRLEVEERLERMMATAGTTTVNRLRDDARRIAGVLDRTGQQGELDRIAAALAGTGQATLAAPAARARAQGRPYDSSRVAMFEDLFAALHQAPEPTRPPGARDGMGHTTLAFFEAYFSNYIEGTKFALEEAADIVFGGHVPQQRPADAHDILRVWRVVSDTAEMRVVPATAAELADLLRRRHATVLGGR